VATKCKTRVLTPTLKSGHKNVGAIKKATQLVVPDTDQFQGCNPRSRLRSNNRDRFGLQLISMIMKVSRFTFGGKNDVDKCWAHLSAELLRNHCQMCSPDEHILSARGCHPIFLPLGAHSAKLHLFASQRDNCAFGRIQRLTTCCNFAHIFLCTASSVLTAFSIYFF